MKILTFNTHSLEEANMPQKQKQFIQALKQLDPDIVALQEVNQTNTSPIVSHTPSTIQIIHKTIPLREDNHVLALDTLLKKEGLSYEIVWSPVKLGYGKYDEGLAFLSKNPIQNIETILLSKQDNYSDFRTRKALKIQTEDGVFVNVHMGWWNDELEPFQDQFIRLDQSIHQEDPLYLMGDFNAEASIPNEGYAQVVKSGYSDLYTLAQQKDDGISVDHVIDGWRNNQNISGMRIDYIFSNKKRNVPWIRTAFRGQEEPILSDHFGVLACLTD